MKRPQSIQIKIPNPCFQNWDEMAPSGNGRHCMHCSTNVIDFTTWTDAELYKFFSNNKQRVCGRVLSTQVGRPIQIPAQPHSRLYRMFLAMGLALIFTNVSDAQVPKAPLTQQVVTQVQPDDGPGTTSIKGTVTDENKTPITTASIRVWENGKTAGGAITDIDGNYKIELSAAGEYRIEVSYMGYHPFATTIAVKKGVTIMNFALKQEVNENAVIVKIYKGALVEPYRVATTLESTVRQRVRLDQWGLPVPELLPEPEFPDFYDKKLHKKKFRLFKKAK